MAFEVEDETVDLISEEYIKHLPTFNHLFDGAIDVLEYLKPKYNLHIITNGFQEVQTGKLRNSKIEHYFTTITNSEMAGVKKPNPKIFEFALNLAKTDKTSSPGSPSREQERSMDLLGGGRHDGEQCTERFGRPTFPDRTTQTELRVCIRRRRSSPSTCTSSLNLAS